MQAGKLNSRVTIQSLGVTQDATGEVIEGWSTFATVWADVRDVSGREFLAAQSTQNVIQTKILIRYLDGVIPSMRVVDGADTYNIETALRQGKVGLLLMCSRLANG